jgi:N-acetyl sugar amidotransferase
MKKTVREYQICTRCIMDTSDPDITFNEKGVCNHCIQHDITASLLVPDSETAKIELDKLVLKIKEVGKGKQYDCIIGLSGGVDSTYVALLIKRLGLRPLAVHLDNGWNSELAVKNIENIVNKLGIDLYTIVIDWAEFKDLQIAYLKAGVVDLEALSDQAIFSTMFKLAKKNNIRYVIGGTNVVTESIMPKTWYYSAKDDLINLLDIYKKFGSGRKLKTYPKFSFLRGQFLGQTMKLEWISILNLVPYIKREIKLEIMEQLGWRDYGGKHHESVITKFYQCYILPKKFGIDKRRAHLSNLVCSSQITREEALIEMALPLYKDENELNSDIEYFQKKLSLTQDEFDAIMNGPARSHYEFKNDKWIRDLFFKVVTLKRKLLN